MSVSVTAPQLGESVTEGTVTRWLKKEGERVEADEPLLEVSTDKVDTEIPSPVSGILRGITVAEDETVEVGAELAVIDESADGAAGAPAPPPGRRPPGRCPPPQTARQPGPPRPRRTGPPPARGPPRRPGRARGPPGDTSPPPLLFSRPSPRRSRPRLPRHRHSSPRRPL